ncbi:MAG TPA: hypothetical protein VMX55_03655 [candidate division Zixibacteria bacterium]|nr:hypothetical protein [candidate division Zixibacteria bacterium]
MNKAIYYKFLFIIAGVWNIGAAVVFSILSPTVESFLPFFGLEQDPIVYIWLYSFLLLVAISGFRYFLVGLDITKNHLVVSSGIISKFSLFILFLVFFIIGEISWPLLVVDAVDLVFASLFIEFFVNFKKLDNSSIVSAYSYKHNV